MPTTSIRIERRVMTVLSPAVLASVVAVACQAGSISEQYSRMAAWEQYLMADPGAEIAMARSAAPEAISRDASIFVLGTSGYKIAVDGKNGFTCLVERSWMSPFDGPEFWNPKIRGPICYNPAAGRAALPYTLNRTKLIAAGLSKAEAHERILASVEKKELPAPEPGAMSYMLSKLGYLGDSAGAWHPHLMFYVPKTDKGSWGANQAGSPVLFDDQAQDIPEPETIFMIPVAHWSDGSAAPPMTNH